MADILVITPCAAICGADDWVAFARFGRERRKRFRSLLRRRHGSPSHDTLGRVFAALGPDAFKAALPARIGRARRAIESAVGDPAKSRPLLARLRKLLDEEPGDPTGWREVVVRPTLEAGKYPLAWA